MIEEEKTKLDWMIEKYNRQHELIMKDLKKRSTKNKK